MGTTTSDSVENFCPWLLDTWVGQFSRDINFLKQIHHRECVAVWLVTVECPKQLHNTHSLSFSVYGQKKVRTTTGAVTEQGGVTEWGGVTKGSGMTEPG